MTESTGRRFIATLLLAANGLLAVVFFVRAVWFGGSVWSWIAWISGVLAVVFGVIDLRQRSRASS